MPIFSAGLARAIHNSKIHWFKMADAKRPDALTYDPRDPQNVVTFRPGEIGNLRYQIQINHCRVSRPETVSETPDQLIRWGKPLGFERIMPGQYVPDSSGRPETTILGDQLFHFILNQAPLSVAHALMLTRTFHPQYVGFEQFKSVCSLLRQLSSTEHAVLFNGNGASCSVNWFHFHLMIDKGALPLFSYTDGLELERKDFGTHAFIVDWPAKGVMFDQLILPNGRSNHLALKRIYAWLLLMQTESIPHSLGMYRGKLFIMPRKSESPASSELGLRFKFGALDVAGEIVIRTLADESGVKITADNVYEQIQAAPTVWQDHISNALESVTFSTQELLEMIRA